MKRWRGELFVGFVLLIGLPLLGVWLAGKSVSQYLEFPPRTRYVVHEPFSWQVFMALALFILGVIIPFVVRIVSVVSPCSQVTLNERDSARRAFPWWGWVGIGWTGLWWVLAWTRLHWMAPLQEYTFTPLWLGYIVVVNAWTLARIGYCPMLRRPRSFLSLFPLSAAFWWFFEYLNRFVQNWHYVGVAELLPLEYFFRATVSFASVLPAVVSTAELLTSLRGVTAGLEQWKPIRVENVELVRWSVLMLSCAGLLGIGLWPNYLFPLVWVGPLLLIVSLQSLAGRPTIMSPLAYGDWGRIWRAALAALICGIVWELWNWKSLVHWEYALPFVHGVEVFEMPLLGYAGYLPFGLECLVVADLCQRSCLPATHRRVGTPCSG